jgi:hypothetical protein
VLRKRGPDTLVEGARRLHPWLSCVNVAPTGGPSGRARPLRYVQLPGSRCRRLRKREPWQGAVRRLLGAALGQRSSIRGRPSKATATACATRTSARHASPRSPDRSPAANAPRAPHRRESPPAPPRPRLGSADGLPSRVAHLSAGVTGPPFDRPLTDRRRRTPAARAFEGRTRAEAQSVHTRARFQGRTCRKGRLRSHRHAYFASGGLRGWQEPRPPGRGRSLRKRAPTRVRVG